MLQAVDALLPVGRVVAHIAGSWILRRKYTWEHPCTSLPGSLNTEMEADVYMPFPQSQIEYFPLQRNPFFAVKFEMLVVYIPVSQRKAFLLLSPLLPLPPQRFFPFYVCVFFPKLFYLKVDVSQKLLFCGIPQTKSVFCKRLSPNKYFKILWKFIAFYS